jgi:AraC-like DNA-binding protein
MWCIAGLPVRNLPTEIVMSAEDTGDAALAGLDQGEIVTIPSLPRRSCRAGITSFPTSLVARHTSASATAPRGMLSKAALERLTEYIFAHLDEPIEVAELAQTVGRSSFHFCRVFSRSVGMSPHRYVHLRLQRAIELVRDRRFGFAEIAARTGFADQSHLTRWIRRVHGVSLEEIARPLMRDQNSKNLHDLWLAPP